MSSERARLVEVRPYREKKKGLLAGALLRLFCSGTEGKTLDQLAIVNEVGADYYAFMEEANAGGDHFPEAAAHVLKLVGYHLRERVEAGWTLEKQVLADALHDGGWYKKPAARLADALVYAFYKS